MNTIHRVMIAVNGGYLKDNKILYVYAKANEASVILTEQAATISFTLSFDMESENYDRYAVSLFMDAYRKIHLIHLFATGVTLTVEKIELTVDDGIASIFDGSCPDFPFIVSMLEGHRFALCDKWRSEVVYDKVSQWPIVASESNLLHCAVSAFLSAQTRKYPGDRLPDLWTAMNSYYSYQAVCFESAQSRAAGVERNDLPAYFRIYGSDACCLTVAAMKDFGFFFEKRILEKSVSWEAPKQAIPLLSGINLGRLDAVYQETEHNFDNIPPETALIPAELYQIASEQHMPMHLFFLFYLPYYLRCELVHGSRSIPILYSSRDGHQIAYQISCFYLERFLNDRIPDMFTAEDTLTERDRELLCCTLRARDKKKTWLAKEDSDRFGLTVPRYIAE